MDVAILILMAVSVLAGAASCFRVPAVSVRSRQYWAAGFAVLLAVSAVLAGLNATATNGAVSPLVAVLVPVLATAAAALTGSPVTAAILELSMRSDRHYRETAGRAESADRLGDIEDPERTSSLHGGLWIGVLERVGVVVTILVGWPTGLTVLAAIKALGRFTELKRADAVERFILGTFASFLWAAAWAGVSILLVRGA